MRVLEGATTPDLDADSAGVDEDPDRGPSASGSAAGVFDGVGPLGGRALGGPGTVQTTRTVLSTVRGRGISPVHDLGTKATEVLRVPCPVPSLQLRRTTHGDHAHPYRHRRQRTRRGHRRPLGRGPIGHPAQRGPARGHPQGLDEFSHIQVVWHFSRGSEADVHLGARHPRGNTAWPQTGTFVHRNHRRPARIAVSHPRLLRVEGRDPHVEDLDAVRGTPVLDIAPWFTEFGPRGEVSRPRWPTEMLAGYRETPTPRP
ncbi:TrmO family methyltransferase domain-containing protein [Marinactinospora thermotolerans]|uniref:TrmO family methyltransferase domain-containing protein n=1 Tax=Marinactinospora thermotolerans TaxID=531310 RepID=UPI002285B5BF|nr:TrmO family methyltransferase [Marinactinospora thermotolerans]